MMVKDILHISLCHGVQKKKDISTLPGGQKYMCAEIHVLFKSTFLSAEAILKPCIEARKKVYLLSICQHRHGDLQWFITLVRENICNPIHAFRAPKKMRKTTVNRNIL